MLPISWDHKCFLGKTFSLLMKINPSVREEKITFSLRFFWKPRFLRREIFSWLESQFETLSTPAFWHGYDRQLLGKSVGKNRYRAKFISSPVEGLKRTSFDHFWINFRRFKVENIFLGFLASLLKLNRKRYKIRQKIKKVPQLESSRDSIFRP